MVDDRDAARDLRAEIERIARAIVVAETARIERRTVTAVQAPKVKGRGGTCTVVDSLGQQSFGVRWYSTRPSVGDLVLVEVPPPGGTRRIVDIDREMSSPTTTSAVLTSIVPPAVQNDPDARYLDVLPELPNDNYPTGTVVSVAGTLYQSNGSTWAQTVEGLAGSGMSGHWQRNLNNGDFSVPPPDPLAPLNNDNNKLLGWAVQDGTGGLVKAYWVADTSSGSGGRIDYVVANGATGTFLLVQNVGVRSTATRNSAALVSFSASCAAPPVATHYMVESSAVEKDSTGTFLRQYVPTWDVSVLTATAVDFYNTAGQANLRANTDSVDVGVGIVQIGAAVATFTVSVQQVQLVIPDPFVAWPDLVQPNNPPALSLYQNGVWSLSQVATGATINKLSTDTPTVTGGYIDLAEIATPGTPASGYHRFYPLADANQASLWGKNSAGAVHAHETVGQLPFVYPLGIGADSVQTTTINLIVDTAGSAGAVATPVWVPCPLTLYNLRIWSIDTVATLRTASWRLYYDRANGTNTLRNVASGTFSFTPAGAAAARVSAPASNPTLLPGLYWLVFRNTSAAVTFGIGMVGRGTLNGGTLARTQNSTGIAVLANTIDISTWAGNAAQPLARLEGSIGSEAAFYA